jgi:regulator of sigma E protease
MTGIIAFIIVFGVLVLVHEFGHFFFAKKFGVRVREFAIGFGPKLLQFRRNGTTYTWRLLPVGGFVRMAGRVDAEENPIRPGMTAVLVLADGVVTRINLSEKVELVGGRVFTVNKADLIDAMTLEGYWESDEETLVTLPVDHDATIIEADGTPLLVAPRDTHIESAKLWHRAVINFAGPLNNFILAVVLFLGVAFALPGVQTTTVDTVASQSAAQVAGLKSGDDILKVDGKDVASWSSLQTIVQASAGKKLTLTVERHEVQKQIVVTPKKVTEAGSSYGQLGITAKTSTAVGDRLDYAWTATVRGFTTIGTAIANLFNGFSLNKLGGPVSIYQSTATVASLGVLSVISFAAWLSINLGLMNLLPIPALDGGKLLLNAIEAVIRRPIPERVENAVTVVGALFLVGLMIAVTWNDIMRYFG